MGCCWWPSSPALARQRIRWRETTSSGGSIKTWTSAYEPSYAPKSPRCHRSQGWVSPQPGVGQDLAAPHTMDLADQEARDTHTTTARTGAARWG
jgi:hypothetical protein